MQSRLMTQLYTLKEQYIQELKIILAICFSDLIHTYKKKFGHENYDLYDCLKIEREYFESINILRYFYEIYTLYLFNMIFKDEYLQENLQKTLFYFKHRKKANKYVDYVDCVIKEINKKVGELKNAI